LGVERLDFDETTVTYTVTTVYVGGRIVGKESKIGTYSVHHNGSDLDIQLNFNTSFIIVDYLLDGTIKTGKYGKVVDLPYILKARKNEEGQIEVSKWSNRYQNERYNASMKQRKDGDYGIDEQMITGKYINKDETSELNINITSILIEEADMVSKQGKVFGSVKMGNYIKDFEIDFKSFHPGTEYNFNIPFKYNGWFYLRMTYKNESLFGNPIDGMGRNGKQFFMELEESNNDNSIVPVEEDFEEKIDYYKINDPDGYSNLRISVNGRIIKKVMEGEKFEVIGSDGEWKKVKLENGTIGFIHNSRIQKI